MLLDFNSNLDVRKGFELLQNQFSIDILYIRATKYIRCKCFNILHQTGDPNCHICIGAGHLSTIEKCQVISQNVGGENIMTELGQTYSPALSFYIKHDKQPKVRDLIVITGWDNKGFPVEVRKVCEITAVEEIRGDNGRIELFHVNTKVRPDQYSPVQRVINKLDHSAKSEIAKWKRYIWPLQK